MGEIVKSNPGKERLVRGSSFPVSFRGPPKLARDCLTRTSETLFESNLRHDTAPSHLRPAQLHDDNRTDSVHYTEE